MPDVLCRAAVFGLFCFHLLAGAAEALVIVNATPEPTAPAALSSLIQDIAAAMVANDASAATQAIASSASFREGSESALAATIYYSISSAEALYTASNQSGITLSLLGSPYHPFNYFAAAFRADVLGQALYDSSIPSSFAGQGFADAFLQSFQTQTAPLQSVYGGFTIAAGSIVAANAANLSQAFDLMFSQAKSAGVQVSNVSSVLGQVTAFLPNNGTAAVSAATKVYGATVQSRNAVAGNATAVAQLIQASVALDAHASTVSTSILYGNKTEQLYGASYDTTNTTANTLAQAILGCNVSTEVLTQALSSVIAGSLGALENGSRGGAAIAIEAAVYAGYIDAVSQGFAQGKAANVSASDACASQLVAQAHSSAAGKVASDAIEAAYGSGTSKNCAMIA